MPSCGTAQHGRRSRKDSVGGLGSRLPELPSGLASRFAGTGTTADAVRHELATGLPSGGTFHLQKAGQYSNALRSVLKQNLNYHDRLVAHSLLDDLQHALGGQP